LKEIRNPYIYQRGGELYGAEQSLQNKKSEYCI